MTALTLTLDARRAHLRQAAKTSGDGSLAELRQALAGAREDERQALTKTLPPSRWFRQEGFTRRACLALAGLGNPKQIVDALMPFEPVKVRALKPHAGVVQHAVVEGARDREAPWLYAFIGTMADHGSGLHAQNWAIVRELVVSRRLRPDSLAYFNRLVQWLVVRQTDGAPQKPTGAQIADALLADAYLMEHEFLQFFRVEGMGGNYQLTDWNAAGWDDALRLVCERRPGLREELLRESLDALLRDFSAKNCVWYHRVHRLLEPSAEDIARHALRYCAVLATAPSTSVGLAQDMLLRGAKAGRVDADALIAASGAVLLRTEKKLLKAQLAILAALDADEAQCQAIAALVAGVRDALPPELRSAADRLGGTDAQADASGAAEAVAGDPVAVPPPRRRPLTTSISAPEPIQDEAGFAAGVAAQLEGSGDGADLPQLLAYGAAHPRMAVDAALLQRAQEVFDGVWDANASSPRRHLAAWLLGRAGEAPSLAFRGYRRYVTVRPGDAYPEGAEIESNTSTSSTYDVESGEWKQVAVHHYRSGYRFFPTHSPAGLLMAQFRAEPLAAPLVYRPRTWLRAVCELGEGTFGRELEVLGAQPRPLWLTPDEALPDATAGFAQRALDVSRVAAEFTFRAQEAREQDGFEQIVQWTAWLLREHPDTLAAHFHPALYTATAVVNVRGIGALMQALGASRQLPGGPVYSALALGLSAKEAAPRAQAAEAVAALAASGLLDPECFAAELGAHMAEGFAMAGRVAQALADAASIGALSGYRVLQTLAALLPGLDGVNGAARLVELAARLSAVYGTPLALPATLASKAKGGSVMAVALRALAAGVAGPTDLAHEAAAEAHATEHEHEHEQEQEQELQE